MAKILVVNDDCYVNFFIKTVLSSLGHKIFSVQNGPDAVAVAKKMEPHIVLLDIQIPGPFDGLEAARKIEEDIHTKMIFFTSYPQEKVRNRLGNIQYDKYISKPIDQAKLEEILIEIAGDVSPPKASITV